MVSSLCALLWSEKKLNRMNVIGLYHKLILEAEGKA